MWKIQVKEFPHKDNNRYYKLVKTNVVWGERKWKRYKNCKFLPMIKQYFIGIKKTWKDKRKGRETYAYCTYEVKNMINEECYKQVKNLNGHLQKKARAGDDYNYGHCIVSFGRFKTHYKIGQIQIENRTFRQNSQGNWR